MWKWLWKYYISAYLFGLDNSILSYNTAYCAFENEWSVSGREENGSQIFGDGNIDPLTYKWVGLGCASI